MTMQIKVTGEKFRVYPEGKRAHVAHRDTTTGEWVERTPAALEDYDDHRDAMRRAYIIAGTLGCDVMVDRVTFHEPIPADNLFRAGDTETVTAEYNHSIPHFASSPLSRYSPVNGWQVPEVIEV